MATTEVPAVQMIRWYTRARRFPQLVGKFPDGRRLPGGPYTITQVILGAGLVVGGLSTRGFWGGRGMIADLFLLSVITGGLVFAAGKIPLGGRNPAAAAAGMVAAIVAPTHGRVAGRPVRLRPPTRLRHHVTIWDSPPPVQPTPQPAVAPLAANERTPAASEAVAQPFPVPTGPSTGLTLPASAPASRVPLPGVQALLAARPAVAAGKPRPDSTHHDNQADVQADVKVTERSTRLGGR